MKMKNVKIVVAMAAAVALMFGSFVSCGNESHDSALIDQDTPPLVITPTKVKTRITHPLHPVMILTKTRSKSLKAAYQ